ncbi:MAG: hypothetical protein MR332_05920 [Fusicatenibacter sp.]|nr:hypothetical protein [Fusicatenibacter sp.]
MSSKTKIIVLHMKEVIYTALFLVLAIFLMVLVFVLFGSKKKDSSAVLSQAGTVSAQYVPGIYTSSVTLGDQTFDVQVNVDENHINSISLNNLSETTAAMYPLMEPSLESLEDQICSTQSTENLTFSDDSKYTSQLLLTAITKALNQAKAES